MHWTRYWEGRPQGRLSYFSTSGLSMAVPFPRGTFKVDPGPGEHGYRCYSNLRKAPSCSRLPALVPAASVALAKRKLSKPRESWHCILSKEPGRDRRLREQWG